MGLGALLDTKENHLNKGYHISQFLLDFTLGEYGHKIEEIYNFNSKFRWENISTQCEFGSSFDRL
jgi:hypothetical protein